MNLLLMKFKTFCDVLSCRLERISQDDTSDGCICHNLSSMQCFRHKIALYAYVRDCLFLGWVELEVGELSMLPSAMSRGF